MINKEKYLRELSAYVRSDNLLYIDSKGKMRRIHCPFPVLVIRVISDLRPGNIVKVEAVKITFELQDVFIIKGKAYMIWNFRIMT